MSTQDEERQPLLLEPDHKATPQVVLPTTDEVGVAEEQSLDEREGLDKELEDGRTAFDRNKFILQVSVTLLGLIGLVLLIKHLIDTGDTEVGQLWEER